MEAAETKKKDARRAWNNAIAWFEEFEISLLLPHKQQILDDATAEEKRRDSIEVAKNSREKRMKLLLNTHERHLKLLNAQVELDHKEKERAAAKALFTSSEKAVVDAQNKLDKTVSDENTCHNNIGESLGELERLRNEHAQAQEGYANQDPKERERSFSTKLEGSGADPG